MARLETIDGGWLELTPTAYQFETDRAEDTHDRNWLWVEFAAELGPQLQVKRRADPAFLTWELVHLVEACRSIIPSELPTRVLDGLEPNLVIDVLDLGDEEYTLAVGAALSFAPHRREPFDQPFEARFQVRKRDLSAFVDQLEGELRLFPPR